jgi:hypothetical protein
MRIVRIGFVFFKTSNGLRQMRNVYQILVGNPEGKRSLRRPRNRREDNIKINFREIVRESGWLKIGMCK